MLVELGLVEQRYQAVLEVLNNSSTVTDVAVRFGVTRQEQLSPGARTTSTFAQLGLLRSTCRRRCIVTV